MSTSREFLQEAAAIVSIGGLGFLPGLNDKEKPQCSERPFALEQINAFKLKYDWWVHRTEKAFEFPDARIVIGLIQGGSDVEGPTHRFYYSSTTSLCGEVDDEISCDLDDSALMYSLAWNELVSKRVSVTEALEDVFQRRVALNHIEVLRKDLLVRDWDDLIPPHTRAQMFGFIFLLAETIADLSPPDCVREEPWAC